MKTYKNSLAAWEGLNESFLRNDEWLDGTIRGGCVYAYNLTVCILKPKLDPEFDFGSHFNYSSRKWTMLVNNYIEPNQLREIKKMVSEAEASKAHAMRFYNLSYKFDSAHTNSKGCLTSIFFSRRGDYKEERASRNMTVVLRASEVTKRLVTDLLLFQRIGEYIWGDEKWNLTIHFNQIFNDDNVLLMYHAHKNIKKILKSEEVDRERRTAILTKLDKLLNTTVEDMPYKIYKRVITVIRKDLYKTPVTLAKDCNLSLDTLKKKKKEDVRDFASDIIASDNPGEYQLKMTDIDHPSWESSFSLTLEDLEDIRKSIDFVLSNSKS